MRELRVAAIQWCAEHPNEAACERAGAGDGDLLAEDGANRQLEAVPCSRHADSGIDVVLFSSEYSTKNAVEAIQKGACDYLTKPIGMDELLARMRAALRHQLQVHGERPVFRTGVKRFVAHQDSDVAVMPLSDRIFWIASASNGSLSQQISRWRPSRAPASISARS